MNTAELFKKDVLDSNANRIGRVVDLVFEIPPGAISHLVVKTGMLHKRNVEVGLVGKSGDSIMLTVPKDDLGLGD